MKSVNSAEEKAKTTPSRQDLPKNVPRFSTTSIPECHFIDESCSNEEATSNTVSALRGKPAENETVVEPKQALPAIEEVVKTSTKPKSATNQLSPRKVKKRVLKRSQTSNSKKLILSSPVAATSNVDIHALSPRQLQQAQRFGKMRRRPSSTVFVCGALLKPEPAQPKMVHKKKISMVTASMNQLSGAKGNETEQLRLKVAQLQEKLRLGSEG